MNLRGFEMFRCLAVMGFVFSAALHASEPDGPIASPEPGWPQFRGPRRDGISTETGLLKSWPEGGPKLLWKHEGLGRGWSSPIVVNDSLYITGDVQGEVQILCLDLQGREKWKAGNGGAWMSNYQGSRASCAYSDGVVYHMNGFGRIVALDASSGKVLWKNESILKQFESKNINWGISECLLVDGPRLIATPGGPQTLMVAFDKKSGEKVWMSEPVPGDTAAYAPPLLVRTGGRRVIVGASSHHGFGVDADSGKLLWTVPVRNNWGATCCEPVYADGKVFYAAPDGPLGAQYALDLAATPPTATQTWKTQVDTLIGSGIYKDGMLYTNGCKKSHALHCIDWKTGESRYEITLSNPTNNHATGALLWADEHLYGLFESGIVALLHPTADKFEIAGQFKLADAPKSDAWAHPVVVNGRLYLRYHDTLSCFDIKAP
jgi:outer membrane protein assembly factor BamB